MKEQKYSDLYAKSNIALVDNCDCSIYKSIIESMPQSIFLFNKDRILMAAYNLDPVLLGEYDEKYLNGKSLNILMNDTLHPFGKGCELLNEIFDDVLNNQSFMSFEFAFLGVEFLATATKADSDKVMCQIRNISPLKGERLKYIEDKWRDELTMALNAGGLMSWSYDVKSRVISSLCTNSAIGSMLSLDACLERIEPEYKQAVIDMLDSIALKKTHHAESKIKMKDIFDENIWLNLHAIPSTYDLDGNVVTITGSQKDVTEEYEREKQFRELNKRTQLILKNAKTGLVYVTSDFKVMWENLSSTFKTEEATKYYCVGTYCYEAMNRTSPCENCIAVKSRESRKSELVEYTTISGVSLEIMSNPILNDRDEVDGFVLRIDDITEKKIAAEQIRESEIAAKSTTQMLTTIIENLPVTLFVKDATDDYRYVIANKLFCEVFGIPQDEVVGKNDYDVFKDKEEADYYRRIDADTIANNKTKIIESENVTLKDRVATWYTVKTPFVSRYDNKVYLVGIGLDITDNRNAYKELELAKKRAEKSDILKSAFLANMSHEIRTPLNAIVGFSELLKDAENEQEKNEYWDIINTNNIMLLRLIGDILDLSKIESGMIELRSEKFNLAGIFENIYLSLVPRNVNKNLEFICKNPYKKCFVSLDENRITQIITNFVTNSFKFTRKGSVEMGYEYVNGGVRLYCTDTGVGIEKEKVGDVFMRFSKLNDYAQGTGLGTAICKAIVDAYGGEIGVDTELGRGSTFWAWIPCNADIDMKDDIKPKSLGDEGADVEKSVSELKILIAEDNDSNFLLVKTMLKNYTIIRANNGLEAVNAVKREHFDAVLMDVKMPIMDGLEATSIIREFDKEMPIIALTANAFESDRNNAFEAGCSDFIAKPVNKSLLLNAIAQAVAL